MASDSSAALILAAGKGTRMHSPKPKALQTLLGEPMLAYALHALAPEFGESIYIVSGHAASCIEAAFPGRKFVRQTEQFGTGHAVLSALPVLEAAHVKNLLVINADVPMITAENISSFMREAVGADVAFASITLPDPASYGRVVRKNGKLRAIVEAKDFDPQIHGAASGEINAGLYWLTLTACQNLLPKLTNDNRNREYYLTDLIALALDAALDVRVVDMGDDPNLLGINSPSELARAEDLLAFRVAERLLENGVIIHNPGQLRCAPFARIEPGAEIDAPCEISGKTVIESSAIIAPYCVIRNARIGRGARILSFSHIEDALIGENAIAGPYARLRPGAELMPDSHVGNFVELKKTRLGKGSKANHLTYLGDAEIGANVNIGAGTITCNYDGKAKHKTTIGDNAFIGSNTAMVAPVEIGENSLVGAGSVITRNVPAHNLAVARARQTNIPERK